MSKAPPSVIAWAGALALAWDDPRLASLGLRGGAAAPGAGVVVTSPSAQAAPSPPAATVPTIDDDYEERAGILEFDAGYSREEAERLAREMYPL